MPAIRDTSFAYESTTTDGGLTIPMGAYEAGDLLVVCLVGDTGTPTVGTTGSPAAWNQLFQRVNTCSMTVLWRYATASEPDVVLTASVNETYSGALIVVKDAYQGYTAGSPPVSTSAAQAAATRFAIPTITTSAADSLCLVFCSSSVSSPSIFMVEDALQDLVKVDGAAEGLGVGWFLKRTAGTTTAYNVGCLAGGAGGAGLMEIRAPSGGALDIPAYPVSDASIFLTPTPGVAYDNNTAIAATADTGFGTTIAGKTCNDATVTTVVGDIGIDKSSFMSFAGVANTASSTAMSGAMAIMHTSRVVVLNRNILCHFRHATPISNQRLAPLSSGRGVWFGMRSGATDGTNYKVWQVHGGDTSLPNGNTLPFIVNVENGDQIASSGTLGLSAQRYGFWTGGLGTLTQQACFGPMWAMDTTVIAGGTPFAPVDIVGIVEAAAKNKIRMSSTLQGSNQMLCLQAIKFGDGGTNPIYLKVNNGAVEFPSRRNLPAKIVNYNGIDDSIGWTFHAGASDTINLAGTAFSSASKYHWRIDAASSGSATYNFTGVVIAGAGDVQLRAVTTFTGMSFNNCPTITQNSAVIDSCTFTNSKIISATLGDMDNISNCSFTSSGTGHAIEVSGTAGTITFTGNDFALYAATNGSTGNEAIFINIATGTVTINISGGNTPSVRTAGATVVVNNTKSKTFTGLPSGTEVRVRRGSKTLATDGNVTSGTYVYSYTPDDKPVTVQFTLPGYVFEDLVLTLNASDETTQVIFAPDPSYSVS